jgi:hypothetical protein
MMPTTVREAAATTSASYLLRDVDFTAEGSYGDVLRRAQFKWKWLARDIVVLDIAHIGEVHVQRGADGRCTAELHAGHRGQARVDQLPVVAEDLDQCCAAVETFIKQRMPFAVSALAGMAARQVGPATERQKLLLRRLYGRYYDQLNAANMRAAQASMLIYKSLATRWVRKHLAKKAQQRDEATARMEDAPLRRALK